jgi:hypothetical protein
MWHSKLVGAGNWAWIYVRLPDLVKVTKLAVYSGHTGYYNPVVGVRFDVRDKWGNYMRRGEKLALQPSDAVAMSYPTLGTHVRIGLQAGPSGFVTVRGIRLFGEAGPGLTGSGELFAPRQLADATPL